MSLTDLKLSNEIASILLLSRDPDGPFEAALTF